ncbi:MAG: tRNA 2-thiocytidine biosynthesis protein TtcA [Clostridiales bacterium]|nr:tRNA 2-thiocytidine biosynthesis protein TtcA [Clostridiales bacterium]
MPREFTRCQSIERSIIKTYRKTLWNPFIAAVKRYELVLEGDRIAVCISGGKDSMLLAKLMQQLQRVSDVPFELTYLVMDPGYAPANRQQILDNAALLEVPVTVFETNIFRVANHTDHSPCYLCARMRRGHLYSKARELGCNKIALGHHFSDVVETTVMGMLYGGQLQAMMPKLHSTHFPGMELIRPMYCIHEDDIIRWKNYNDLHFLQCACRFTEATGEGNLPGKRQEVKELLRQLRQDFPQVEQNVFKAIHSVQLDTFPGYKTKGEVHSFLEEY